MRMYGDIKKEKKYGLFAITRNRVDKWRKESSIQSPLNFEYKIGEVKFNL